MRLFSIFDKPKQEQIETRSTGYDPMWMQALNSALSASTGTRPVNENLSLTVAAVYSAVKLLSELPASLPVNHLELKDGYFKVNQSGPLAETLRRPNDFQTSFTFYQTMLMRLQLRGNAFAFIKRTADRIELIPVYQDHVGVLISPDGDEVFYQVNGVSFASDEFLHFKGMSLDGFLGLSPIQYASRTINNAIDAERYMEKVYERGIITTGFFVTSEKLNDKSFERLQESIKGKSGIDRAGEAQLLDAGVKFERNTLSAVDASVLEQLDYSVEEIARMFRTPKHLLYLDSKGGSTRSFSVQAREFLTYTLMPLMSNIEEELEKKLFTSSQEFQNSNQIRFDTKSLLRADPNERAAFYKDLFNIGSITPNEIRADEGFEPIDGGDQAFVQLNLAPLDQIDKIIEDKINQQINSTNG